MAIGRIIAGLATNRHLKKAGLIILLAIFNIAFAIIANARKIRVPNRDFLHEQIIDPEKQKIDVPSVKILIDGKYYIVPDRAKMDSLGIAFKPRMVIVCTGPYSECFHLKYNCSGLSNCSDSLIEFREDSIPSNLRNCHICARKFRYIDSRNYPDSCLIRF